VDGVLLVIGAGKTRRAAVRQVVESLHRVGAKVVGAVLNGVSPQDVGSYGYYYYGEDTKAHRQHRPKGWLQQIPLLGRLFSR
jgi:Mrp family chromosome partitioning ATPase